MDITISKQQLSQALYVTQSIVEKKTTMPILSNLMLSASEGKLTISATDLEITAVTSAEADVRKGGSTTVSARVFAEIVKELPDSDVEIKLTEGERLEIKANNSKLRMIGVSAEEYPSLPGISLAVKNKIVSSQFLDMINKTLYAVSLDETRFNLNGVCLELVGEGKGRKSEKQLRMIATDGHRLAMITRPAGDFEFESGVIVPRKGLSELKKILEADSDSQVGFDVQEGFLIVDNGRTKISMRLIDGEFPDYKQVLPKEKGVLVKAESGDIAHALRRVALMVTDKGKCVKMDFKKGAVRISSSSPELGDASEELAVNYDGEPLSVGFNAKYIIDFTQTLGEDQGLCIELHGELGPGKFFGESDESYIGIVMPMRLT